VADRYRGAGCDNPRISKISMVAMKPSGCCVYVALIHHSMLDKNGMVVTTAVTNLDIHDIARSCRTYGVKNYFLVNPLSEQQDVVKRIMGHWQGSGGRDYNPDRADAFERVKIVSWFQDVLQEIEGIRLVRSAGSDFPWRPP
jgi:hypothetical protein